MEVRRGRKRKPLLDDLNETIGRWQLREKAPDRSVETRFGRGYEPTEYRLYECLSM